MKELTKSEEQIMQYLWKIRKGFLKDIVEQFSEPRPAYTTVSTIIRILVKKEIIGYNTYGKIHEYYPLVSRESYLRQQMKRMMKSYFSGSYKQFASFFAGDGDLDIKDLEEIKQMIEEQIETKKPEK